MNESYRYKRARADFEALEEITPLVDSVELDCMREELMRNPTKSTAADCYEMGIRLWRGERAFDESEEILEELPARLRKRLDDY